MKTAHIKLTGLVLFLAVMIIKSTAVADPVLQWDLRDYDNNGTISAFTFVSPPDFPDGTTGLEGGIRFGDQIVQIDPLTGLPFDPPLTKETRCLLTDAELQAIFASGPFETVYPSDFGLPCNPVFFDKGGPTDVRDFTFGFLFSGAPFFPSIAATKANPDDLVGDTGDVSGEITIDRDGNRALTFSQLDFAGVFGTTLFILPPTTNPPGDADPDDPSTIREVDPSTVVIQELVPLGGTQFGVAAQWLSKIFEEGSSFNNNVARWRVEGVMTVSDEQPTIFLNGANPASVPPGGSYVDAGAVCQDVVDGGITVTTIPADPDIPNVGAGGTSFTITYNCTDSAGNSADPVVRTVNVEVDTTPPDITLLAGEPEPGRSDAPDGSSVDIVVGVTYIDAGATCLDNADGDVPLGTTGSPAFTFAPTTVDTSTASTGNEIVFTCTDSSGNTATATRTVNVIADDVPPVLTLGGLPELTVSVGSDFAVNTPPTTCADTNPIDTDPVDISQNVNFAPTTVDTSFPQSVTITYNCDDFAGNAAEPVTQIVNVIGGGQSFNILSMTITDVDGDGLAGCFKFGGLDPATCDLANAFSSDGSVTGLAGGNMTIPGTGTDLDDNGEPIGIRFGVFQSTKAMTPGFMFTGFPFEPFTFDPPSEDALPPSGSVLVIGSTASLILDSFPFGGLYSSNQPNAFFLDPDPGTLSATITADNNDGDGTTRTFNYLMTWSHVITEEEDPTNQFTNFNAFWRLEGKVTVDSNPTAANDPPIISAMRAMQVGEVTRLVVSGEGLVTVEADVTDPDGDAISYDWSATDSAIVPIDGTTNETLVFDPAELEPGLYAVRLVVTDDAAEPNSAGRELVLEVLAEAPELGPEDSDGDGIPDDQEGFGDADNDALPNFQDPIDGSVEPNRNRLLYSDSGLGDATSDLGQLSLGTTAFSAGDASFIITEEDVSNHGGLGGTPVDNAQDRLNRVSGLGHSGGGIHDWTVSGLELGETVCVILPQNVPLPNRPIYRRYTRENGWVDFVIGGADSLASTRRVGGVCPEDPADYDASQGLVEGDDCVRVCVTDGGANDLDTLRNGSVSDPASVAGDGPVPKSVEDSDIGGCTLSAGNRATITPLQRLDLWLLVVFIAVLGAYRRRPLRLRKT